MNKYELKYKTVHAMVISRVDAVDFDDGTPTKVRLTGVTDGEVSDMVDVSKEFYQSHLPRSGGYYLLYDGKIDSYMSKIAFEEGYDMLD